jgi:hypothetical protein
MCKEMLVITVNKVVDRNRMVGKNGGPRRRSWVARWFIFKPKIPTWVNFGGP